MRLLSEDYNGWDESSNPNVFNGMNKENRLHAHRVYFELKKAVNNRVSEGTRELVNACYMFNYNNV